MYKSISFFQAYLRVGSQQKSMITPLPLISPLLVLLLLLGDANGKVTLAAMYMCGMGVAKDEARANLLFLEVSRRKACLLSSIDWQESRDSTYLASNPPLLLPRRGRGIDMQAL